MILEQGRADEETVVSFRGVRRAPRPRMRGHESLGRLDDGRVGRESATREEDGEEAGRGRPARMQGFRHRSEPGFEARRLRPCEPECVGPLLLVEPEEMCAGRRGAERPQRARGMEPDRVVARAEQAAEPAFELDPGDERCEELLAARLLRLREREERRQHRR